MGNNPLTGFSFLVHGTRELTLPGTRRYVFIPLLANSIVFIFLTIFLIQRYQLISQWLNNTLPDWWWLGFAAAFLSGLIIFFTLLIYGFSFTAITNIIAAPFYGFLASRVERRHRNLKLAQTEAIGQIIVRTVNRELIKFWYFFTRGLIVSIALFCLSLIPILQLLAPLLAFAWACWVMSLQYIDYTADNNNVEFKTLRQQLKPYFLSNIGFGGGVFIFSSIPVLNIFIVPTAVAGGSLYWLHMQNDHLEEIEKKESVFEGSKKLPKH